VKTAKGEVKYKELAEVADTDEVQVNQSGDPIVMKGAPGRKPTPSMAPANSTVAAILRRKQDVLDTDPVYLKTRRTPDSPDVLHEVIVGLSEEAASLKFERDEAAREGKDTAGLSAKRVQALRAVGETWLKRMDQVSGKLINMDTPAFQALWKFFMETIRDAMVNTKMRPEQVETVFAKFATLVGTDEWRSEAKNRMKMSV